MHVDISRIKMRREISMLSTQISKQLNILQNKRRQNMKKYETPEMELLEIEVENIILESNQDGKIDYGTDD